MSGFRADISDEHGPRVSDVYGDLVTNAAHTGRETVVFNAADRGVGIYRAVAEARIGGMGDWQEIVATPLAPSSPCSPLNETTNPYEFDRPQPCPTLITGAALSVDNSLLPAGVHEFRAVVEDAAGNRTLIIPAGPYAVGGSQSATSEAPGGVTAVRGAQLQITTPRGRRLRSAGRFRIAGRFVDRDSRPIAGASLLVRTRPFFPKARTSSGRWTDLAHVVTDANGVFRGVIPAGPSRSIMVAYPAGDADSPAVTAVTDVAVPARISVRARRSRITNGRSAVFRGRVAGPIPSGGVLVALEVRQPGRWIPVATTRRWVRTKRDGTFALSYRFTRTFQPATYRFRVVAAEDSAFQYTRGASRPIAIHVRPR